MNIPFEFVAGLIILSLGGGAAWITSVERRLSATEALIAKIDKLVDVFLEDRLNSLTSHR